MKKIYYPEFYYGDLSLEEILFETSNFTKDQYTNVSNDNTMYYESLEEILNIANEDSTSCFIAEYSLSEEDMYRLFFDREVTSIPTKYWFYWWDEGQNKLREINLTLI